MTLQKCRIIILSIFIFFSIKSFSVDETVVWGIDADGSYAKIFSIEKPDGYNQFADISGAITRASEDCYNKIARALNHKDITLVDRYLIGLNEAVVYEPENLKKLFSIFNSNDRKVNYLNHGSCNGICPYASVLSNYAVTDRLQFGYVYLESGDIAYADAALVNLGADRSWVNENLEAVRNFGVFRGSALVDSQIITNLVSTLNYPYNQRKGISYWVAKDEVDSYDNLESLECQLIEKPQPKSRLARSLFEKVY